MNKAPQQPGPTQRRDVRDPGTDALFTPSTKARTPTEVHNQLKRFFYDNYQFRNSFDIYAFLGLLADASSNNSAWTTEDGQLLLTTIAKVGVVEEAGIVQMQMLNVIFRIPAFFVSTISWFGKESQRAPVRYLSSDFVVKSIMSHLINAVYMLLMEHFDKFAQNVQSCMKDIVENLKTFNEPGAPTARAIGGSQTFGALITVLYQCLTRVKNATTKYPPLRALVHDIKQWLDIWTAAISSKPPAFQDPLTSSSEQIREQICKHLADKVDQLVNIVDRDHNKAQRPKKQVQVQAGSSEEGMLAALHNSYVGPGETRQEGPRHDNDFVDIADIRIAPTHEELVCRIPPFLPANLFGAPHPLPSESPEKLLDTQFRLLREELTAPLRTSVQQILDDLRSSKKQTQLSEVIKRGGGKYRGHSDSQDSVLFNVYTNVEFANISPERRGISITLSLDTPPGRARATESGRRASFWEGMSGKRLMSGGLVALIWKTGANIDVHLGLISSTLRDHVASARQSATKITIKVAFFDPEVELRILHELRRPVHEREGVKLLIEATVMFASIRPFLEALRVEPTSVPFTKYLVHRPKDFLRTMAVDPPRYARLPEFTFQLSSLFDASAGVEDLKLKATDADSVLAVRQLLREQSRLDPSQADAVVDALIREVALIQGPPGTGKSYTGVELLRVLINNKAGPILMIAFTNHALDHMLCSVLDAGITQKIVRLGSRSADERISKFSIEVMEEVAGKSRLDRVFANNFRELKVVEDEVKKLLKDSLRTTIDTAELVSHLEVAYPILFHSFYDMPSWVTLLCQLSKASADGGGDWTRIGQGGRDEDVDESELAYWLSGGDLEFLELAYIQPIRNPPKSVNKSTADIAETSTAATNQYQALDVETGDDSDSSDSLSVDESDEGLRESALDVEVPPEEAWMLIEDAEPQPTQEPAAAALEAQQVPEHISAQAAPGSEPFEFSESAGTSTLAIRPSDFYDVRDFLHYTGYSQLPMMPTTNRPLETLVDLDDVWEMSLPERRRLHAYWTEEVRRTVEENRVQEFERLRKKHAEALQKFEEGKAEARCRLLKNVDIIGCTTTGAANLTALLKAIGPKIMLVEEAGQVLEAHVLGSLVGSVQHLILIGDPLQLRPTLNNYALSMDHRHGSLIYKFDMSLMERLSSSGFPMSQINVQRRMRPTISDLVRKTLYPQLEDHDLVKNYPPVHGLAKSVFFLSHNHKENGGDDDAVSKFNAYEVSMITDLVMYLLRQGPYGGEGDIVVLCAYLGQLARMRDALADKVAVVIDERDQRELADREAETDAVAAATSSVEHVKVTRRVRLRTIDNYQGEEAKIVILSLVRNSGGSEEDEVVHGHSNIARANVGFLKSENRTNVALSRAREGLFILGNAKDLASRSKMWRTVINLLEKDDGVGNGFPIICHRHPEDVQCVSKPGQLPRIAPDGGCLRQCDARLGCGHMCPFKCHSDDPNHVAAICRQQCTRLCARGHPCSKSCAEDCGKCQTLVANVELPCGHTKSHVRCAFLDDLSDVTCNEVVRKKLPNCEHEADMKCSDDPSRHRCSVSIPASAAFTANICATNLVLPIMSVQPSVVQSVDRSVCMLDAARNVLPHALPAKSHVPGSVHTIRALCLADQSAHAYREELDTVVDLVLQRTLADVDPDMETVDDMLITIPNCGHVFTVETLDGHLEMTSYYGQDDSGKWTTLQSPPTGFLKYPTCPSCRATITCPRYGRIFKRAGLDILENNVASHMSTSLATISRRLDGFSKEAAGEKLRVDAADPNLNIVKPLVGDLKSRRQKQRTVLRETRSVPVSVTMLDPAEDLHGVSMPEAKAWRSNVRDLLTAYREAYGVAATRSSHRRAWEASFSYLYQAEMDAIIRDPEHAPRNPGEYAMRMAKLRIGQPQPRADMRFLVESFWTSINIRLTLVNLAKTWLSALSSRSGYPTESKRVWELYIFFILSSCTKDAELTMTITQESESHKQAIKTTLLLMHIEVEQFKLNIDLLRDKGKFEELRPEMKERVAAKYATARELASRSINEYKALTSHSANRGEEFEWLTANFAVPSQLILGEWQEIEKSMRVVFYVPPPSGQELENVIAGLMKADLTLSHTGHFYKCPNGHIYVIGECGGAVEQAVCPECHAPVGGRSHTLLSSNSRATEIEEIARAQGAQRSPWPWAQ
ncbi:hypothetical protein NM688_g5751 [Phlebia brevispora]|uniref:Uncharacterized protein n=1 Tax=Phlebia brevispora TaxID=194682 RepID=A0ACC1SQ98_9APHY|nr:hypothetical protein NM688_g5751 [Phlebia brevispora]